jgi:hypothetical protein
MYHIFTLKFIYNTALSTISNRIGGLTGKIMDTKPLDVVTGCYWVEIYNHENSVINNNDNNTNDSEEFLNFIELNLNYNILKKFDKINSKIMCVLVPISAVKMTVPGFLAGGTGFTENKLSIENIIVGTKILVVEKTLLLRYFYIYIYLCIYEVYIYMYMKCIYIYIYINISINVSLSICTYI